jgi:aryl-alcohol dehydrogenase
MKIKAPLLNELTGVFEMHDDIEIADPKANEVLIKVVSSGVCRSDQLGRSSGLTPMPAVLGHEGAGIVQKVGEGVTYVKPGDHVVMCINSCGECEWCFKGYPARCDRFLEDLFFSGRLKDGTTRLSMNGKPVYEFAGQGSFGTYAVCDVRGIVKIDEDVDLRIVGPLGCGFNTGSGAVFNQCRPEPGDSIMVTGAGAVGFGGLMAAKAMGCTTIIALDVHESRLELAKELCATHTINTKGMDRAAITAAVRAICPQGVSCSFDTSSYVECWNACVSSLATKGRMVAVRSDSLLDSTDPRNKALVDGRIIQATQQGDTVPQVNIPKMIRLFKAGMFPFDRLIKFYDQKDVNQAFADSDSGVTIKPVLLMEG